MHLALGADHAGVDMKDQLAQQLREAGHQVTDHGTHGTASVDYPDFAGLVARQVAAGEAQLGILVCGTGIGVAISANKVRGARAANCSEPYSAKMARAHNDANVLTLGSRVLGPSLAEAIVEAFIATDFEGGRHARRVDKIRRLELSDAG